MLNFTPTPEQEKILKWIDTGIGNAIIDAKAGTGKSTLIELAIRQILKRNPSEKIAYFAFNRDIVKKMTERFRDDNFNSLKIMTCHSFGYTILLENGVVENGQQLDEYKYIRGLDSFLEENADDDYFSLSFDDKARYESNLRQLLDYARYGKAQSPKEIAKTAERFGVIPVSDECKIAAKILSRYSFDLRKGLVDYTDMVWLPCEMGLNTKRVYNFVFVDESQDLSPIEQELVLKALDKRRGRIIFVGDKYQSINAWCGADRNAFETYSKMKHMNTFPLTVCQRCAKNIIAKARQIVPEITAKADAPDGEVNFNVSIDTPTDGDMVLCRYTLPLVQYQLYLTRIGKKSYILGNDIANLITRDLNNYNDKTRMDKDCIDGGIIPVMWNRFLDDLEKRETEMNLPEEEVLKYCPEIVERYDIARTIETISDYSMTLGDFKKKLELICCNEPKDGIMLSTIHKAKGGEAKNVFYISGAPSLVNKNKAQWETDQETNLKYVMITRARESLNFLSKNDLIDKNISSMADMKKHIEIKRKQLSRS